MCWIRCSRRGFEGVGPPGAWLNRSLHSADPKTHRVSGYAKGGPELGRRARTVEEKPGPLRLVGTLSTAVLAGPDRRPPADRPGWRARVRHPPGTAAGGRHGFGGRHLEHRQSDAHVPTARRPGRPRRPRRGRSPNRTGRTGACAATACTRGGPGRDERSPAASGCEPAKPPVRNADLAPYPAPPGQVPGQGAPQAAGRPVAAQGFRLTEPKIKVYPVGRHRGVRPVRPEGCAGLLLLR